MCSSVSFKKHLVFTSSAHNTISSNFSRSFLRPCRRERISLLVPFQTNEPVRRATWKWLKRYWRTQLPGAEIIIGRDKKAIKTWYRRRPATFSKSAAVNNAFKRSHGDVIVILDADAWMDAAVLTHCAERLRAQRRAGVRSWFVPYRWLYRLTKEASAQILRSSANTRPFCYPSPPAPQDIEGTHGSGQGHLFGALVLVLPREAFVKVGGMDPRFRGWGGEDVSFLRALDTLWGRHANTPNEVLHLWHPRIVAPFEGPDHKLRMWDGQASPAANDSLAALYHFASGHPDRMRHLSGG